jgi:serine/threonine protein kinase
VCLLQRILRVDYEFPSSVKLSTDCKDLISRLLVADPTKRITLPEILRHPWYLQDLPPGVAEMNDELLAASEASAPSGQVCWPPPEEWQMWPFAHIGVEVL